MRQTLLLLLALTLAGKLGAQVSGTIGGRPFLMEGRLVYSGCEAAGKEVCDSIWGYADVRKGVAYYYELRGDTAGYKDLHISAVRKSKLDFHPHQVNIYETSDNNLMPHAWELVIETRGGRKVTDFQKIFRSGYVHEARHEFCSMHCRSQEDALYWLERIRSGR